MAKKQVAPASRPLSELEGAVLGELAKRGESTAYALRRCFASSPSSHWSGSAGAVYPVVERLAAERLVVARDATTGKRAARKFAITAAGRKRLAAWLLQPFGRELDSLPPDRVRTRVHFLGALSVRDRESFLRAAIEHLRWQREVLEGTVPFDDCERYVLRGADAMLAAQQQWLTGLLAVGTNGGAKGVSPRA